MQEQTGIIKKCSILTKNALPPSIPGLGGLQWLLGCTKIGPVAAPPSGGKALLRYMHLLKVHPIPIKALMVSRRPWEEAMMTHTGRIHIHVSKSSKSLLFGNK